MITIPIEFVETGYFSQVLYKQDTKTGEFKPVALFVEPGRAYEFMERCSGTGNYVVKTIPNGVIKVDLEEK